MVNSQKSISERLKNYSHILIPVLEESRRIGVKAYCVGGFVRDILLGIETRDYDFVVEGDVKELAYSLFKKFKGRKLKYFERFGTASFELGENERIDFARARKEIYPKPGEHPVITFVDRVEEDLGRRDFTINSMAISFEFGKDISAELIDLFGGEKDIREKKIRVLHPRSISDDPTRMLRAVRFSVKLGFSISEETIESFEIAKKSSAFFNVSGDRFFSEIKIASHEEKFLDFILKADEISLLFSINPALPLREKEKEEILKKLPHIKDADEKVAFFLSIYAKRKENSSFEIFRFFKVSKKIKEKVENSIKQS